MNPYPEGRDHTVWEETVLDFSERRNAINEIPIAGRRRSMRDTAKGLCEAQAEVSFKAAAGAERERIIDLLQDLLEMSEKNKEPAIKIKMMDVLSALKELGIEDNTS